MNVKQEVFSFFKHTVPQTNGTPAENHILNLYISNINKDLSDELIANSLEWSCLYSDIYPNILSITFDLFAISASLSEYERVYSRAKYTITGRKNSINSGIVEAEITLCFWIKCKIIIIIFHDHF